MATTLEQYGLQSLSVDDRIELMELIWDSVDDNPIHLPDWHVEELQRRIQNPVDLSKCVKWEDIRSKWIGEQ